MFPPPFHSIPNSFTKIQHLSSVFFQPQPPSSGNHRSSPGPSSTGDLSLQKERALEDNKQCVPTIPGALKKGGRRAEIVLSNM
ncbi:hypothetical protein EWB00_000242 [Schistosoma japonicum]|uniref:Uncharacterized protein n=1 Tax=Schistosoma japonicum TaxID=6182 RepID=A0A4Z2CKH9_SCHJA|nr:hypothetical protein EWB00_000242 [Schistosoma japonicum]